MGRSKSEKTVWITLAVALLSGAALSQNRDALKRRFRAQNDDGGPQERSSGSSWPSSESLWSDIPKSDNFDLRNWRNWQQQQQQQNSDNDDQEFVPPQLQGNRQFKRNIPTSSGNNHQQQQLQNFGNFPGSAGFSKPDFYAPSSPSNSQFPKANVFDPQAFQPGPGGDDSGDDDDQQQYDFQVSYNENDNKNFRGNFHQPTFRKSPQEGAGGGGVGGGFQPQQATSGFTPSSFGAPSGFPTSVGYNTDSGPSSDDTAGFYDINDDGDDGAGRGQHDFDFPSAGSFGEPKDGRGGVSQSYSTYTGPDGKSSGFFVQDHNDGTVPGQQIKQQIETSINNAQGKASPGNRGYSGRPNFEASEDEDDVSSFGPPVVSFGDSERFKRGSQTQEKFHKNDKKSAGYDNKKTYRQPLQKIEYNREEPHTEHKTFNTNFGTVKTFKGGYSSDDKDAHLRPPPTYNYELIDDDDGEGKFEGPQQEQDGENFRKNPARNGREEDFYVPKTQEDKVRPKYEEMAYEDRWRSRQDRKLNKRPQVQEDDEEEAEGGGDGEEEGQGQAEEEEEQPERPQGRNLGRRGRQGRQGQAGRRRQQKKNVVDAEEESKLTPTWVWDPANFRF